MTGRSKGPPGRDYEVGYRKPPVETRFQKGKSGNSRGRPRGSRTIASVLAKVLDGNVAVRIGPDVHRVGRLEAILLKLAESALKGDVSAAKAIVDCAARYGHHP